MRYFSGSTFNSPFSLTFRGENKNFRVNYTQDNLSKDFDQEITTEKVYTLISILKNAPSDEVLIGICKLLAEIFCKLALYYSRF